jgi:uncharacterized membrane-anchored protein YjiN (DUF445 family)
MKPLVLKIEEYIEKKSKQNLDRQRRLRSNKELVTNIQLQREVLKHQITQNIQEVSDERWFYSVIHYGNYDNLGFLRPWEERKWLYQEEQIRKVHRYLGRLLREHLKIKYLYFTLERHQSSLERIVEGPHLQYGDERKGKYHTNILISPISDDLIRKPHSKLLRLKNELPSRLYGDDLVDLKIDLINSCLRKCPWVNRYTPSVKTQVLNSVEDLTRTGHYSLKDITSKGLDFMEVLDTENSDIKHKGRE